MAPPEITNTTNNNTGTPQVTPSGITATATAGIAKQKPRIPEFDPNDPELWVTLLENALAAAKVTSPLDKYCELTAAIPVTLYSTVRDILVQPANENSYDTLKDAIISRTALSEEQRVRQLLSQEKLGDRSPTQLLRSMLTLSGNKEGNSIIRQLFLSQLPLQVQQILAASSTASLDDMAKMADRILLTTTKQVSSICDLDTPSCSTAVASNAQTDVIATLIEQVASLTKAMTALQEQNNERNSRSNKRSTQGRRGRSRSKSRDRRADFKQGICWYHNRFGSEATKCTKPCNWENSTSQC